MSSLMSKLSETIDSDILKQLQALCLANKQHELIRVLHRHSSEEGGAVHVGAREHAAAIGLECAQLGASASELVRQATSLRIGLEIEVEIVVEIDVEIKLPRLEQGGER